MAGGPAPILYARRVIKELTKARGSWNQNKSNQREITKERGGYLVNPKVTYTEGTLSNPLNATTQSSSSSGSRPSCPFSTHPQSRSRYHSDSSPSSTAPHLLCPPFCHC